MAMTVTCDSCGSQFRLEESLLKGARGARIRCRSCGGMILIRNPGCAPRPSRGGTAGETVIECVDGMYRPPAGPAASPPGRTSGRQRRFRVPVLLGVLAVAGAALAAYFLLLAGSGRPPAVQAPAPETPAAPGGRPSYRVLDEEGRAGRLADGQEYFLVTGAVANPGGGSSDAILVKVSLLGADNQVIAEGESFAGNRLDETLIPHMTRAGIEEYLGRRFGEADLNRGIPQGGSLPFMVVVFSPTDPVKFHTTVAMDAGEPVLPVKISP